MREPGFIYHMLTVDESIVCVETEQWTRTTPTEDCRIQCSRLKKFTFFPLKI